MAIQEIFLNLPVKDLGRSVEFFSKMGFEFDSRFTDENATCMIVAEHIYVMLLVEPFFETFIDTGLCDATTDTEAIMALSVENRAEVDEMVARAVAAGATTPRPIQDLGFMYSQAFRDLDGHLWELFYMDPSAMGKS